MFSKCKKLLAEWLDHSQRNSGYMCDENYSKAIAELKAAETLVTSNNKHLDKSFLCSAFELNSEWCAVNEKYKCGKKPCLINRM